MLILSILHSPKRDLVAGLAAQFAERALSLACPGPGPGNTAIDKNMYKCILLGKI